jgi:hypothetical protein
MERGNHFAKSLSLFIGAFRRTTRDWYVKCGRPDTFSHAFLEQLPTAAACNTLATPERDAMNLSRSNVIAINIVAAGLASQAASAQIATFTANPWFMPACAGANCAQNVSVGFIPIGATFVVGVTFTNPGAFANTCPACKENDRPFMVPPGILMHLMAEKPAHAHKIRALPRLPHARRGDDLDKDDDNGEDATALSSGAGISSGVGTGMSSVIGDGGNSALGGANSVAATSPLLAAQVTVNPEPSTLVLLAGGMLTLVPLIRRKSRGWRG